MLKKVLAMLLTLVVVMSMITACGTAATNEPAAETKGEAAESQGEASGDDADNPWAGIMDYSEEDTIVYTAFGNAPDDMDMVLDLINERLMKLCNTKLQMNFISLADWTTKYPLALADGENDLIYTASWNGYATESGKGAFYELTDEFISTYLPVTKEVMADAAWKQAAIDGKIYGVPRNQHDNNNYGAFLIRKDIMEATGYEEINSYEELFDFALKAAEVMDPAEGYSFYNFPSMPQYNPTAQLKDHQINVYSNIVWNYDEEIAADASNLEFSYLSECYHNYILRCAEWAEAGVWPSTAINSETHTEEQWKEGHSAFYPSRYTEAGAQLQAVEDKGYEVVYTVVLDEGAKVRLTGYSGDMTAITQLSHNPERAAVVLDILRNDEEINLLCQGGIEGKHYILNDDGTRSAGPDADKYGWSCWAWALRDMNHYPTEALNPKVQAVLDKLDTHVMDDSEWPFDGFVTNDDAYDGMSAQVAVVNSIISEYQYSFDLGVFGADTEATYQKFVQELKDAGIDELMAEWRKQAAEYMAK